jgi:nitrite reductase/ring-hydroxylating ferredoxin subunit
VRRRRFAAFVDALLGNRRPRHFEPQSDDADAMRAAIELRAAQPGATLPSPEFVADLHQRLTEEFDQPGSEPAQPKAIPLTRRRALQGVTVAAAAAAIGVVVDRELLSSSDNADTTQANAKTLEPDRGTWQPVAASADVTAGQVKPFSTATTVGFVVNDGGNLRALSGVCTHQGCLLRHNEADGRLDCPCHRAAFSLDGKVLFHEFPGTLDPLPAVNVRDHDGNVEVYVPPPTV